MIAVRPSEERGHADHGWLDTRHTFSFADYYDPRHMHFRTLRVINEDLVAPGRGFDLHPHDNMEIVTCVLAGALEHRDSLGNGSVIRPGDVQRMTAGTGILHSEFNPSRTEAVHLLQIWILPARRGLAPGYEQRTFAADRRRDRLCLLASPDGSEGSLTIHQDVRLYGAELAKDAAVAHDLGEGRHAWVQLTRGAVDLNGTTLRAGDGAAVSREARVAIAALEPAHLLLFDLA